MSISPDAYTKFIELAQDNRFLRYAPVALDAYWIWRSGLVRPSCVSFGLTEGNEHYELEDIGAQNVRTHENSTQVRMCLIGACMVGKRVKTSLRFDAADEYGLTLAEVDAIIAGFDDNAILPGGDTEAVNFGRMVHAIVFSDPELAADPARQAVTHE